MNVYTIIAFVLFYPLWFTSRQTISVILCILLYILFPPAVFSCCTVSVRRSYHQSARAALCIQPLSNHRYPAATTASGHPMMEEKTWHQDEGPWQPHFKSKEKQRKKKKTLWWMCLTDHHQLLPLPFFTITPTSRGTVWSQFPTLSLFCIFPFLMLNTVIYLTKKQSPCTQHTVLKWPCKALHAVPTIGCTPLYAFPHSYL